MRRKEKSLRDVESRRRWASYSNWGILTPQKAKIFNNVKGEKLFYFSFSKKLRQQQPKKKKKPTTSVDDPASHFTEKGEETKEDFHLFLPPSQPTYLDGWSLLPDKANLFLHGALTHFKALLLQLPPPLVSSTLLLLWYVVGYFY